MRRVVFCGSRNWGDPQPIARYIHQLLPDTVVVHGGARGADAIAARLAKARGLRVEKFPAR